jgi:hypothetical protein
MLDQRRGNVLAYLCHCQVLEIIEKQTVTVVMGGLRYDWAN